MSPRTALFALFNLVLSVHAWGEPTKSANPFDIIINPIKDVIGAFQGLTFDGVGLSVIQVPPASVDFWEASPCNFPAGQM